MTEPGELRATGEERDLVRRLVVGDRDAWVEFVRRYQNLVWACVRRTARRCRLVLPEPELEDMAAEVFATLIDRDYAALRRFEGRCSLASWLAVIARRRCLRRLRDRLPRPSHLPADAGGEPVAADSHDPLATLVRQEDAQRLSGAMHELNDADRRVLHLYYQEQLEYADIARRLGIATNSVGPRIHRAQQRLRRLLERRTEADSTLRDT
jgi:RNA polymerase sigma-70 factor (ECF subfamily)